MQNSSYTDIENLPIQLNEFEINEDIIEKLVVVKWQHFGGDYQGWVMDCSCENDKGRTRVFALFYGDVFFDKEDVVSWFKELERNCKKVELIKHRSKKFDIHKISPKMHDPHFLAELHY